MDNKEKWHEIFKADCDEGLTEIITEKDLPKKFPIYKNYVTDPITGLTFEVVKYDKEPIKLTIQANSSCF